MLIREYKPEDREAVEKCIRELHMGEIPFRPDYWVRSDEIAAPYFDYLEKRTKERDGKIFVAESEDKVVGYVAVRIEKEDSPRVIEKKHAHISNIVILEEYQRKGIGKMLLKRAEDFGRENNAKNIYLAVSKNKPAIEFYHHHGYVDQSICMEKKL